MRKSFQFLRARSKSRKQASVIILDLHDLERDDGPDRHACETLPLADRLVN